MAQCDCQKLWSTGNLKEGINKVVPEEPGKMRYIQPWVNEVSEWATGAIDGNGNWKSEGVARRFKTAQYTYKYVIHKHNGLNCSCFLPLRETKFSVEFVLINLILALLRTQNKTNRNQWRITATDVFYRTCIFLCKLRPKVWDSNHAVKANALPLTNDQQACPTTVNTRKK
jgi:hypothetical protein